MNKYLLPPSRSRCIEIAVQDFDLSWHPDDKPIDAIAPLKIRKLWLRETIYDGRFMLGVYDRETDTMYLREPSPEDVAVRKAALE